MLHVWFTAMADDYFGNDHVNTCQQPKRKRRGPLTRVACNACRSKKLKCSGEEGQCQRCRARGLDCYYETESRSSSVEDCILSASPTSDYQPAKNKIQRCKGHYSEEEQSEPSNKRQNSQPRLLSIESPSLRPADDTVHADLMQADCYDTLFLPDIPSFEMDEFSCMTTPVNFGTVQLPTPDGSSSNSSAKSNGSLHLVDEDLLRIEPDNLRHASESRPCACTSMTLKHHEDACINLQWAMRGLISATPAEVLQCLKRVMEGYDDVLGCHSHQSHPETISLLLSTCDMMVTGTERLSYNITGEGAENDAIKNKARHKTTIGPRMNRPEDCKRSGQYFGQFVLDEEDERCIFHTLVAVRTRRLSALLKRLYEVADRHGRPVHIRLIQNLQERCEVVLESLLRQDTQG